MRNYALSDAQKTELRIAHRKTRDRQVADRIKVVLALANGISVYLLSEIFLIDEKTIRNYYDMYQEQGINGLSNNNYKGSSPKLSKEKCDELIEYLDANIMTSSKPIIEHIKKQYKINYSQSGVIELLHRLGFSYKKPKHVPGKQEPEKQREFVQKYAQMKSEKGENDVILFGDATHPQHNSVPSYGWIKKGVEKELKSNCGRQRLNINGVINIDTLESTVGFYDTINSQSTIDLFQKVENKYSQSKRIIIIVDNALYYKSRLMNQYLSTSRIELLYLPPYSPNLNLIERYWKFFKKIVLNNKYYETFSDFIDAAKGFFRKRKKYIPELKSLLTENFHISSA